MEERRESSSSREQDEEEKELERCWSNLQDDMLSLIKERLFAGDLCAFNTVCKSWQSTAFIRSLPPPIDCQHRESPCLMFVHRDTNSINFKLFHPIYNGFYNMETPALISDAEIRFSKYGWLLMSRADLSVFFYNPFSKAIIELPGMPLPVGFDSMCFSSQPTSSDCLVMGVSRCPWIGIGIVKRGENFWSVLAYENPKNYLISDCSPILYKDKYYCLTDNGVLGVYDPNCQSWKFQGKPFQCLICQSFLADMDEQLLAVFVTDDQRRLLVRKFDFIKMVWQKVPSLGDKKLYVSRSSSFAEIATVNGMANKIYLPNFCGDNGVFYSVSTGKYHSFGGDFSSNMTCNKLRGIRFSTWIKPPSELEASCDKELCW